MGWTLDVNLVEDYGVKVSVGIDGEEGSTNWDDWEILEIKVVDSEWVEQITADGDDIDHIIDKHFSIGINDYIKEHEQYMYQNL